LQNRNTHGLLIVAHLGQSAGQESSGVTKPGRAAEAFFPYE